MRTRLARSGATMISKVDAEVKAAANAATGDPLVLLLSYAVVAAEVARVDDARVSARAVEAGAAPPRPSSS